MANLSHSKIYPSNPTQYITKLSVRQELNFNGAAAAHGVHNTLRIMQEVYKHRFLNKFILPGKGPEVLNLSPSK